MIKAIIFDWYGVIFGQGFDYTYRNAGGDPSRDKEFTEELLKQTSSGKLSSNEFNQKMADHLNISLSKWYEAVDQAEQADEELLSYINSLKGKYKIAVLSNASKGALESNFSPHNLEDYFDEIIVSADVGMLKPDNKIYTLTAERLGVNPEECVFIDNSRENVEGAGKVGMKTILYLSLSQFKSELKEVLT